MTRKTDNKTNSKTEPFFRDTRAWPWRAGVLALLVCLMPSLPGHAQQGNAAPATETPAIEADAERAAPAPEKPESEKSESEKSESEKSSSPLGTLERWMDKYTTDLKDSFDASQKKLRKLHESNEQATKDAAKDAADALKALSGVNIVEGREKCAIAPNGAADCQAAAEAICQTKGFKTGKSADIQTKSKCSAQAFLSGASRREACVTETFVVKASCQ